MSCTVRFRQIGLGRSVSNTVTFPVQELEFPLWSVTETVTEFEPVLLHVKEDWEEVKETIVQLSVGNPAGGPLKVTVPEVFRYTVGFWQAKVGLVVSMTEIVAEQLAVLELLSVTVRVTEFAPRLRQLKLVGESERLSAPQANAEEPLLTAAAVTDPFPVPFRNTVRF